MSRSHFFVFLTLLFVLSCTKPPDYPDEPVIEFLSMSKNTMLQSDVFGDSLTVTISFTDGDGDIGQDENTAQIFILDTRFDPPNLEPTISIPLVPEQGAGNGISGTMTFLLYSKCCFLYPPTGPVQTCEPIAGFPTDTTLVYEMYIIDRAGNESNRITTDPITLLCQ